MTDRQKALEWFRERRTSVMMSGAKAMYNEAVKALEELEERGEGKWIEGKIYRDVIECNCSECGQLMTTAATVRMNYCPNCGADMRGEQDDSI